MSDDIEWETVQLTPTHRISFSNQKAYDLWYEKHRAEIKDFQVVENCECMFVLKTFC